MRKWLFLQQETSPHLGTITGEQALERRSGCMAVLKKVEYNGICDAFLAAGHATTA